MKICPILLYNQANQTIELQSLEREIMERNTKLAGVVEVKTKDYGIFNIG